MIQVSFVKTQHLKALLLHKRSPQHACHFKVYSWLLLSYCYQSLVFISVQILALGEISASLLRFCRIFLNPYCFNSMNRGVYLHVCQLRLNLIVTGSSCAEGRDRQLEVPLTVFIPSLHRIPVFFYIIALPSGPAQKNFIRLLKTRDTYVLT